MKTLALFLLISYCALGQSYPDNRNTPKSHTKHGISFNDDYMWLENVRSADVEKWANAQTSLTQSHLKSILDKSNIERKIREYDQSAPNGIPKKQGRYFYWSLRKDKNLPSSIFFSKTLNDEPVELINTAKFQSDNKIAVSGLFPSAHSKVLAFELSIDGSDVTDMRFVDLNKNSMLPDILKQVKSSAAWNVDAGVFYKKNTNAAEFAQDSTYQLFYHRLGTDQVLDELVFDTSASKNHFSFFTKDNRLFVIETVLGTATRNFYWALLGAGPFKLEKFITDDAQEFKIHAYRNGKVYFSRSDYDWGEIRCFDALNPKVEKKVVSQLYLHLLTDTYFTDDYIFCKYRYNGRNYFIAYDHEGVFVRKFDVPHAMDFDFRYYLPETKDLVVTFNSLVIPYLNYTINIVSGRSDVFYSQFIRPKPTLFPFDYFETKVTSFKNRDGIDVPITIVHKKGMKLDGTNPTLLKTYGGYGAITEAHYDTGLLYFMENGGVYAHVEIRGSGEKGLQWHRDGQRQKKINGINDFIDAAEYLIREKYTNSNHLGISGTSHGGIVVGAAMTMRPELFKAAVPVVGVFDMIRFDLFTVGELNHAEFGNPEKADDFKALLAYSPYHNVKDNVDYPTTLIITGENDDRVPPLHSYKFAARLQDRPVQKNRIYLQASEKSGHYGRYTSYNDRVKGKAQLYGFLLYHLK